LFVDVAAVTATDLTPPPPTEGTAEAAARGGAAREKQGRRFGDALANRRPVNADAPGADIELLCGLDTGAKALLAKAAEQLALSAWGLSPRAEGLSDDR
jgi:magnesium chelatase family protein